MTLDIRREVVDAVLRRLLTASTLLLLAFLSGHDISLYGLDSTTT